MASRLTARKRVADDWAAYLERKTRRNPSVHAVFLFFGPKVFGCSMSNCLLSHSVKARAVSTRSMSRAILKALFQFKAQLSKIPPKYRVKERPRRALVWPALVYELEQRYKHQLAMCFLFGRRSGQYTFSIHNGPGLKVKRFGSGVFRSTMDSAVKLGLKGWARKR